MKKIIALILYFVCTSLVAAEMATDSFLVTAYSDHYEVASPSKYDGKVSIILTNRTLVDLIGRIESSKGALIANIRVPKGKSKSVLLTNKYQKEKYVFVPFSPAFQEVTLVFGNKVYEIPSQK